jgi:hypothetical protein
MHDTGARREPPREEKIVSAAREDAASAFRLSALAKLMRCGLWAGTALLLGAARSASAGDDGDPADRYGDFA